MNLFKCSSYFSLSSLLILMAGCGGGSSGGSTSDTLPPPKVMSVGFGNLAETIAENTTYLLPLEIKDSKGIPNVKIQISGESSNLALSNIDNKNIEIKVADLNNDSSLSFSVSVTDPVDSTTHSKQFQVKLVNTSGQLVLLDIKKTKSASKEFINQHEERQVISALGYLAVLHGTLSFSEWESKRTEWLKARTDVEKAKFSESFAYDIESKYLNNEIDEKVLIAHLADMNIAALQYSKPMMMALSELNELLKDTIPQLSIEGVYLNRTVDKISLFTGNPKLGSHVGESWVFAAPFQFLSGLIGQSACNING